MELVSKTFQIDDPTVKDYLEDIISNGMDDMTSSEEFFESIAPFLENTKHECVDIKQFCEDLYKKLAIGDCDKAIEKLDAPVHIGSLDKFDVGPTEPDIWITKPEKKSQVDKKKLDKAEQKIKQKQERKNENNKIKPDVEEKQSEATASQVLNRKDQKSEQRGTNKSVDIHIENFDVAFGSRVLFENADLHLNYGRRYGLVGRNGMGKTTLLKMLSNGGLTLPSHIRILHVEQEVVGDDTIALNSVLQSDTEREELLKEEKSLQLQIENSTTTSSDLTTKLNNVYIKLADIEADKAPARAAIVLNGLGFTTQMQAMTTKEFSGGWRMRLALARALFAKPDLLLLDEPTNMLDMRAILWLENYLQNWPSTILTVSHDRSFLESICTDILHLFNQQLDCYRGSFEQFILTKEEKLKNKQREFEAQQEYRDSLQIFIDRFRYNANRASQVQSKLKLLERLPKLKPVEKEKPVVMKFPTHETKLQGNVLQIDEGTFSYDGKRNIFENVNISAGLDSRICIVGENGSGKTTLLKLLIGENEPVKGIRHVHRGLKIGYFSQHHVDQLEMNITCLELMATKFPGKNTEIYYHQLGSYGITGDLALRKISTLSGGQKSRLAFAVMSMPQPNFLILDEPTNHLDMETIDALAISINNFAGGVILVSHDERLIEKVCKELWLCRDKQVKSIEGGLILYKKLLEEEFNRLGIC